MESRTALTFRDIEDGIKEYLLAGKTQYALLLSGEWGVGKTYFVKNTLIKDLPDRFEYIYISLFGISSLEKLNDLVSTELLLRLVKKSHLKKSKTWAIANAIGKTGFNALLKKYMIAKEDLVNVKNLLGVNLTYNEFTVKY
jgi:hypothetical protein